MRLSRLTASLLSLPFLLGADIEKGPTQSPNPIVRKRTENQTGKILSQWPGIIPQELNPHQLEQIAIRERKDSLEMSVDEGLITKELAAKILAMPLKKGLDLANQIRERYYAVKNSFMKGHISEDEARKLLAMPVKEGFKKICDIDNAIKDGKREVHDLERKIATEYFFEAVIDGRLKSEEFRLNQENLTLQGTDPISELSIEPEKANEIDEFKLQKWKYELDQMDRYLKASGKVFSA